MNRRQFLYTVVNSLTQQTVIPGDILLTRNSGGERNNPSPGYYNHSAIVGPLNWIIEAQQAPNSVIAVPIWDFWNRYPEILVLRPYSQQIAKITSQRSVLYIGRKYSKYMSVRPLWLWKDGDNCVSLIRRIYNDTTGIDYKWRIPDNLLSVKWLKKALLKKDYKHFKTPNNPYKGMIKKWENKRAI